MPGIIRESVDGGFAEEDVMCIQIVQALEGEGVTDFICVPVMQVQRGCKDGVTNI